ncbi:MAG: Spy/CpxP family protein refolding chaperone [Endomicrobiales bacterium]
MKTRIMAIALAISFAFNLAVLATFAHHRLTKKEFRKWPKESSWHQKKMRAMLGLTEDQAQLMEKDREALRKAIEPVREELQKKRSELFTLLSADPVDNARVDALVAGISSLQMKMEKNVIEHSLAIRKYLTPEQQKKLQDSLHKDFGKFTRRPGHRREKGPF